MENAPGGRLRGSLPKVGQSAKSFGCEGPAGTDRQGHTEPQVILPWWEERRLKAKTGAAENMRVLCKPTYFYEADLDVKQTTSYAFEKCSHSE